MKITHKIDIHLDNYRPAPEIVVMQCDANTRELQFTLYSNNAAWSVPESAKIYVGYSKPDGTGGFYNTLPDGTGACTAESNMVTAVLAEQVLTVPGKVFVSVSLQEEGQILATFAVQLNVKPKPGIAVMQSENYFCLKALIDAATVAAQKPVQVITVSENADGGYVSSHYLSGIQSIINLQLPVACHWYEQDVTLCLVEYQNGGPFTFAAVSNAIEYRVVIKSDEDISCTMTKLAGSDAIPTKVSQLQNDSGFLTEAPMTTTKVELTKQTDGSYLSDLSAADIMAAYKDHKTVHCYHNKMILPLIRSVVNDAVFGGIYDGQIHTVTVASNRVATVTVIPLSSGGGSDGITPHIGANGNWWIGEEDTGVSAGVTDEQISGAVEEYMEENPLVKTVNGTAPDENGNVKLDIPSGGGGGGGYARNKLVYSLTLTEQVSSIAISFTPEQQVILENANGYAIALNLLSGEGVVAEDKNPGNVDIRPGYRHDAIQLAGAVPTDKTSVTEIPSVGYVDRRLAHVLPNGGSVLVRTVVRAKVSPTYTHPNTRCTTDFKNEFTITLDYPVGIGSSVKVYAIDVAGV